jgi:hypothetical protein
MTPQALGAAALAGPKRGARGGLFGQCSAQHGNPDAMLTVLQRNGYQSLDQQGTLKRGAGLSAAGTRFRGDCSIHAFAAE